MALVFVLYIVALVFVLPNATTFGTYVMGLCIVGFSFGGTLALMPAFTADLFGTKNLGVNYGLLFSAYSVAGSVLTPYAIRYAIRVPQVTGTWTTAFWYLAVACCFGLVLTFVTKTPVRAPTPA